MNTLFVQRSRTRVHHAAAVIAGLFLLLVLYLWFAPEYRAHHKDIFHAAEARDYERVSSLIDADRRAVFSRDRQGRSALHWAADPRDNVSPADAKRVLELLLEESDVNGQNNAGQTPLHIASNGFAGRCSPEEASTVELLLSHGATVNMKDNTAQMPLQLAAENACETVVLILLTHGADTNVLFSVGGILHVAAERGFLRVGAFVLEHGVDVNVRNKQGWTPLHEAVVRKRADMVEFLLKHGANPRSQDNLGNSPLDFALGGGFDDYSGTMEMARGSSRPCTPGPGGCTYLQSNSYTSHGDAFISDLLTRHLKQ